ncbi:hypothetical protein EMCRGX_G013644 [Ephydatia muelleri]
MPLLIMSERSRVTVTGEADDPAAPYLEPGSEYSHLDPEEDGLGPLEENDLIAFAYQIADGMVRTLGEGEIPYHLVETNIGIRRDGCTLLRESQVNRSTFGKSEYLLLPVQTF